MNIKPVEIGQTLARETVSTQESAVDSKVEIKGSFGEAKQNLKGIKEKIEFQKSQVDKLLENLNDIMGIFNVQLKFSIHEETKQIMVTVKNIKTDEVIREIPPKEVLDLAAKILEMVGILVDKKV